MDSERIIAFHSYLLEDQLRTGCYEAAIARLVRPGDVVVDIGTGTGILALFACRAGARKVYAIEAGAVIELARLIACANGLQHQITFISKMSTEVCLPERADILITETGGTFGLQGGMLGATIDGRKRFLKENGRVVPSRLDLWVAPVEFPRGYESVEIWKQGLYGFDFSAIRTFAANNDYASSGLDARHLLGEGELLTRIVFSKMEDTYVQGSVSLQIKKAGVLQGFAGWQSTEVATGITFTNSPVHPTIHWKQSFLPIEHPCPVVAGDVVAIVISTNNGAQWRWRGNVKNTHGEEKALFDHSTFHGFPINPDALKPEPPSAIKSGSCAASETLDGDVEGKNRDAQSNDALPRARSLR
jgi:hypothetical protein